jgi:hypothetical protein
MEKVVVLAIAIALLFLLAKAAEGRFLEWEPQRALKHWLRDAIIALLSAIAVIYANTYFQDSIQDFLSILTGVRKLIPEKAQIFTGEPEF